MVTAIEERQLRVFCPTHRINFEVAQAARILCESGGHALAHAFPHEDFWEYCCDCQVFWPSEMDKGGKAKENCPVCSRATTRRYVCDSCKLMSIESDDPGKRKSFRITTRGAVEPACPGCEGATTAVLYEHVCEEAAAAFRTGRARCPFCEEPIKRPEPPRAGEEKIFCGNCGTRAAPDHDFCMHCGRPVGAAAARGNTYPPTHPGDGPPPFMPPPLPPPGPAPPVGGAPPYAPPQPAPTPPAPKSSGGALVAVGVVLVVLVIIVVAMVTRGPSGGRGPGGGGTAERNLFKEKFERALAAEQFFAPPGNSVADLYEAELARAPDSPALKEAATKIRTRLDPVGENAIQNYYTRSDTTIDWGYISQVYELLKRVAPENSEYSARHAYSLGLTDLKYDRFESAVSNFQEALRHRPDWVMAYNGLGRVYVQDEWPGRDYSKTVEYYRKACDLDANFTWGCRNLAAYYMKFDNWTAAEEYMAKALQRSPGRETIKKDMGKICPKVGKYQDTSTGFCQSY